MLTAFVALPLILIFRRGKSEGSLWSVAEGTQAHEAANVSTNVVNLMTRVEALEGELVSV